MLRYNGQGTSDCVAREDFSKCAEGKGLKRGVRGAAEEVSSSLCVAHNTSQILARHGQQHSCVPHAPALLWLRNLHGTHCSIKCWQLTLS